MTPADITLLNFLMAPMNDHIKAQAKARGYGFFTIGALYDRPDLKSAPYSVVNQLTSKFPYSPFISLDGVHSSPLGHVVLATAAAFAFNANYGANDLATRSVRANVLSDQSLSLSDAVEEQQLPAAALEQAKRIAAANAGRKFSTSCVVRVPGLSGC